MTRVVLVAILILFSISSVSFVDSLMQESLGKFLGTFGAVKQYIPLRYSSYAKKKKDIFVMRLFRVLYNDVTFLFRVRIPELLNQLCNQSQGSNTTRRDACYGCFYRTSVLPQGYSMLVAMSACADTYLNNTSYGHCQAYLRVRAWNDRSFILFSNIRFVIILRCRNFTIRPDFTFPLECDRNAQCTKSSVDILLVPRMHSSSQ